MSDRGNRPPGALPSPPVIMFASRNAAGASIRPQMSVAPGSGSGPFSVANEVQSFPFVLSAPSTSINKGFWLNGSSAGSTSSISIWDADFNKIIESATATGSGNSVPQMVALAVKLPPGLYYCGLAHNSTTTNHFFRWQGSFTGNWAMMGCWKQGSITVGSLPATATPTAPTAGTWGVFGLTTRTVFDV